MPTSNGYALSTAPERWGPLDEVPEEELADRDALWRRLRRDGYLLVRGLLDRETVLDSRPPDPKRFEWRHTGEIEAELMPAAGRIKDDSLREQFLRAAAKSLERNGG